MNILDQIHKTAICTAFDRWYGPTRYGLYTSLLEESQWWSWPMLQALQMNKLARLVQHAYDNVPFYRRRFQEAGVQPAEIQSPGDLGRIPLLTREDIQHNQDTLLATSVDRQHLRENHTGGSTGHPLTFYQDRPFQDWMAAEGLRTYRMAGYAMGERWAFLWGSDYDSRSHTGWQGRLKDRLIYNVSWINTFDVTSDTLAEAAHRLACFRPRLLVAYVSSARLLAQLVQEKGIPLQLRALQTSAEVLTPDDRTLLAQTFGCNIFDRYGCREVYNIAHECDAHQGLHILAENNLVECLDGNGKPVPPGTLGRIVVTNLNNYAMPFIRYEVGDMGILSSQSCACGRGLPLLTSIVGRTADVITSPGGKLLHGEFFTHLFYKLAGVRQFRVIQETLPRLRIQIVPEPDFNQQEVCTFLEETIHQHGDPGFDIAFELCTDIPAGPSGKYRFTISHVPLTL